MDNNQDPYNRAGLVAFLGSVVFCLAFFVYISFIHPGVDLKEVQAPAEGASQMVAANTTPWVFTDEGVARGAAVYKSNCAVCHGDKGMGDGPAGAALVPKPRNLVEGKWKQGGTSVDLFNTLVKGIPGSPMAAFNYLPVNDRWALVHFMRSITKDKPADDEAALGAFGASAK
jgi:mono/diheme cytochrome c family protein